MFTKLKLMFKKFKILKCEDCGTTKDNVSKTICPYHKEINNIKIKVILCDTCWVKRGQDV